MAFADIYLAKQRDFSPSVFVSVPSDLGIIITIPAYREPQLRRSLESIAQCALPPCSTEVIVLINDADNSPEADIRFNDETYNELISWVEKHNQPKLNFYILRHKSIPSKIAGVGTARKLAMDEAVYRFNAIDKKNGIITGFDADATLSVNYLTEIYRHFKQKPKTNGLSLMFEHPIEGEEFPQEQYQWICNYELYLRYYRRGLKWAGLPYAFHTIGSSFAVRAEAYTKQGGMNRRKAGEDFYFLNKIIPLGKYYNLLTACIFPSPRVSDRVPFGTGAAISKMAENKIPADYPTFPPEGFVILSQLNAYVYEIAAQQCSCIALDNRLIQYLDTENWTEALDNCRKNTATAEQFVKRFYVWFDGLKALQLLNYLYPDYETKVPIFESAIELLKMSNIQPNCASAKHLLAQYRQLEKNDPENF
jgi:hypothetical protein